MQYLAKNKKKNVFFLDNCAQIWGMDGPYCDIKYMCEDEKIRFLREE